MEATRQGVWDWHYKAHAPYISPHWTTLFGYDCSQPVLSQWKKLIHPDDRKNALNALTLHLRGESDFFESTHRLRCRNGHYKWMQLRGRIIERNSRSKAVRFIGTFADATEQQLQQQQRDLLAANVPGMLYQFQSNTDGHSFFPYTSNGIQDIYAVTPEQALTDATQVFQRIHSDDLEHVRHSIQASANSVAIWQANTASTCPVAASAGSATLPAPSDWIPAIPYGTAIFTTLPTPNSRRSSCWKPGAH